jgi:hypothetical protein
MKIAAMGAGGVGGADMKLHDLENGGKLQAQGLYLNGQ